MSKKKKREKKQKINAAYCRSAAPLLIARGPTLGHRVPVCHLQLPWPKQIMMQVKREQEKRKLRGGYELPCTDPWSMRKSTRRGEHDFSRTITNRRRTVKARLTSELVTG